MAVKPKRPYTGALKHYKVEDTYKLELGGKNVTCWELRCPRKDCGELFVVQRVKFRNSRPDFVGRSCPYCFRPSLVPGTQKEKAQ